MVAKVPLGSCPRVAILALSTHGDVPVQRWRVNGLWGLHLYRYGATLVVEGESHELHYGDVGWTPPGALTEYHFRGPSTHLFAHLDWSQSAATELMDLPIVGSLGKHFPDIWDRMSEAMGWAGSNPNRTSARIWDLIHEIADITTTPDFQDLPEPVRQAIAYIEQRLDGPLSVPEIANAVSMSHNHLTRLFRRYTGATITETIQDRRVSRAKHLLQHSDLPVKQIASMVGLADLQQFNKTVRKHLGNSPSAIRTDFRTKP